MKKISSAIMLGTILFFINCSNAGDTAKDDPTNKFYQSVIQLGNGFLDVFTSFGGLVADALGFKADPKKSEVKTYFDSLAKKLEETKTDLNKLTKMNNEEAPKGSNEKSGNGKSVNGIAGGAVESAIKEISGWLEEMAKAAKVAAAAATGGADAVGNVVKAENNKAAKGGEATSVNGIADGIKGIVDAAEKAGEAGKLNVVAATGDGNTDAGKLFANKKKNNDEGGGDGKDAGKAAAAVSAVSGEQILKAIVDAAKGGEKAAVDDVKDAKNPIAAAIGSKEEQAAAAFATMKKDDQIAAAIVLRGMAKDGEFALKNADHGDHKGTVKNAVESAVTKTVTSLTNLVRKAVQSGLKTVGDAVKDSGSKTPTATAGS
ncbi:variable large family protein [Borreliella carolinensis]|uniref:variable large family protein n=1 Tax=Borreliella carolinensis TaxID=478174 RepID=UPI003AF0494E